MTNFKLKNNRFTSLSKVISKFYYCSIHLITFHFGVYFINVTKSNISIESMATTKQKIWVNRNLIAAFLLFYERFLETFLKQWQFRNDVGDCFHECFLWLVIGGRLNAKHEFLFQWMWDFVAGKQNVRIFQQLIANHVAQCMVFFVYGENRSIWHFFIELLHNFLLVIEQQKRFECRLCIHCYGNTELRSLFIEKFLNLIKFLSERCLIRCYCISYLTSNDLPMQCQSSLVASKYTIDIENMYKISCVHLALTHWFVITCSFATGTNTKTFNPSIDWKRTRWHFQIWNKIHFNQMSNAQHFLFHARDLVIFCEQIGIY